VTEEQKNPSRRRNWLDRHLIKVLLSVGFLLFIAFLVLPRAIQIVPAGHVGVVFSTLGSGTKTDPEDMLGPGLHIVNPINEVTLYKTRLQVRGIDVVALTSEGLNVGIQLSLRFTVQKKFAGFLHRDLGPNYIESQLIPAAQRITLAEVALKRAQDLYSVSRSEMKASIESDLQEDLRNISKSVPLLDTYIMLNDVLIQEIKLPELVNTAIDLKETLRQTKEGYAFRLQIADLERQRKRMEAEGIQRYQRIIADSLTPEYLRYEGIKATLHLAESPNSKVIVIGSDGNLPIILDTNGAPTTPTPNTDPTPAGTGQPQASSSTSLHRINKDPSLLGDEHLDLTGLPNTTGATPNPTVGNTDTVN
jgi:regulator of protease activity HflC (stomatin/prohibitin superfamily)